MPRPRALVARGRAYFGRLRVFVSPGAMVGIGVSWIAIAAAFVWIAVTAATTANLHKTDLVACQFLNADANVRLEQGVTTRTRQLATETSFVNDANAFLDLFEQARARGKVQPGVVVFERYVQAEKQLVISIRDGTALNVALSNKLAAEGQRLAAQLHC